MVRKLCSERMCPYRVPLKIKYSKLYNACDNSFDTMADTCNEGEWCI
jgi:hypothetical protein